MVKAAIVQTEAVGKPKRRPVEVIKHYPVDAFNRSIMVLAEDCGPGGAHTKYLVFLPSEVGGELPEEPTLVLQFQNGPLAEGINGLTNEVLLGIVLDRFLGFQSGPGRCNENGYAVDRIMNTLRLLEQRSTRVAFDIARQKLEEEKRAKAAQS